MLKRISHYPKTVIFFFLRVYQLAISALLPYCCRFHPSCSTYTIEAIKMHGCLKGCYYASRRLMRCHPWHPGGTDHIP